MFAGIGGAKAYTVVGWGDVVRSGTTTRVRAADPLQAIEQVRRHQTRDWRVIAVFEGEPKLVASWPEFLQRMNRIESRPSDFYTVFGFWLGSGEAAVQTVEAGGGVVACMLFVARLGGEEVQVLGCFSGRPAVLITAENLPAEYI